MKKIKIYDHRNRNIAISVIVVVIVILLFLIIGNLWIRYRISKEVIIQENILQNEVEWLDESQQETFDIQKIIEDNTDQEIKEVIETQVVELEYETEYQNNAQLPKGAIQVLQQGKDGKQELIIRKQYKGNAVLPINLHI